jgi:hypothetical protein
MKSLGIDDKLLQPRAALSRISQAKNRMESPDDVKSSGLEPARFTGEPRLRGVPAHADQCRGARF